jgi:RNA polymerase sigma-70 factor (ECF subfamily)
VSFFKKNKIPKTEKELILLAKKNSNYFAPIYKKYHEQIYRFVYQRMDSQDDAADITSQVFLKALINLHKYEFRGFLFSSWLYRIALNEVNQHYRKNKNKRTVSINENDIKTIIDETGDSYDNEKREKLLKALSSLDEDKIVLIEMRFFEKRSFKEIAQVLNITENNAKVRTYRILDEMKQIMAVNN